MNSWPNSISYLGLHEYKKKGMTFKTFKSYISLQKWDCLGLGVAGGEGPLTPVFSHLTFILSPHRHLSFLIQAFILLLFLIVICLLMKTRQVKVRL